MNVISLTPGSAHLLQDLRGMDEFDGEIILREKNLTASQRGNLSDLKKKGLVDLVCEDKDAKGNLNWYVVDMTTEVVSTEPDYSDIDEADLAALRVSVDRMTDSASAAADLLDAFVTTIRENR